MDDMGTNDTSVGEVEGGRALDAIVSEHVGVLYDRRIPRSRAKVAHIVIPHAGA
jgi:hypothetical protein